MNCQNCGANIDGKAFCPQCGTPAPAQQPYAQQPYAQPVYAQQAPAQPNNHVQVLVFGIIGLALSWSGLVGLIFSIVALKKANTFIATYGDVSNQVRIARRLAIAGIILSAIMMVIWLIYFIMIVIVVTNGKSTYTARYVN